MHTSLPREIFMKTLHENDKLKKYFFQSISAKLNNNINSENNKEMANIMIAKIKMQKFIKLLLLIQKKQYLNAFNRKEKIPTILLRDERRNVYCYRF